MEFNTAPQSEDIMTEGPFDVVGIGQCSLDYLGTVTEYPPADTKCEFSNMLVQGGGPVATALVALSRWGLCCAFNGVVGNDRFGRMIQASLDQEGLDTRGIKVRQGYESQFAFIVAEPGAGRRTIFWRRPTGAGLSFAELDMDLIRKAGVVHTDGMFAEASIKACREAKAAKVPVVVDAGSVRQGMLELAANSDYFLASATFASAFSGSDDPREACRKLLELGPRLTAVTLGPKGYVALSGDGFIQKPAYAVQAVDTTGCGDLFHAGFIYGLIRGWSLAKCLDFGAWAGAMVSLKLGGRAGIPKVENYRSQVY